MWRDHIFSKVNMANKILRLIKRTVCGTSNKDVIKKLYIHMVRPHLEYACEVWIFERLNRSSITPCYQANY